MTFISKPIFLLLAALLLVTEGGYAAMDSKAFDVVPSGDSTYGQLKTLEDGGLLPSDSVQGPLTRFEVAEKISKAKEKLKEIVVAQADLELPPPPGDGTAPAVPAVPSAGDSTTASAQTTPTDDKPLWNNPQKIQAAEQALTSLQDAYALEIQLVKDQKADLTDKLSQAESDQYDLWKMVKSVQDNPNVSIHGLGRALGISQQYYGNYAGIAFPNPSVMDFKEYLDMEPTGSVSKEITFDGVFRLGSFGLPETWNPTSVNPGADFFELRRITANFSPDFMTATIGDFYESYSPFTIWNRNNLDLVYVPEAVGRWDDIQKYESYFDQEPDWPFRGLRIGTQIVWPNSRVLDTFKISTFANIINNAFNDTVKNVTYYGPSELYTGWDFGVEAEIKSKKIYLGETSWQAALSDYVVILDNPWGTQEPGTTYSATDPSTWAHQYVINSFKPSLRIGFGGDVYVGLETENAFSSYQDNILNSNSITSDFALNIEPYLQVGDSKVSLHYLNVGPYFYSPLAQTRQDAISLPNGSAPNYVPSFELFHQPILSQFFLSEVPRAGGVFGYYDRTLDNTFPYGLATPNREGVGTEVDIETLEKKSLKIKGSAYFVQEIIANEVVDDAGTAFTSLDPAPNGTAPVRNFTYINFGPSFDFGPNIGLDTPLEVGTNIRYEQTTSAVGTLNSFGLWGGLRVGIVEEWEVDLALGAQSANGTEEGINGTTLARYSYVFDNTDLGSYKPFTVNDSVGYYLLSTSFRFDRNSTLYLDYDLSSGNELQTVGQITGTLQNQFIGMTYEVKF